MHSPASVCIHVHLPSLRAQRGLVRTRSRGGTGETEGEQLRLQSLRHRLHFILFPLIRRNCSPYSANGKPESFLQVTRQRQNSVSNPSLYLGAVDLYPSFLAVVQRHDVSALACHRPLSPRHENSFFAEGKMDFDLPVPGRGASNATPKRQKVPLAPQEELTIPHRTMAFRDTGAQRTGERLFIVFHFTNTVKTNPANRIADSAGPGK